MRNCSLRLMLLKCYGVVRVSRTKHIDSFIINSLNNSVASWLKIMLIIKHQHILNIEDKVNTQQYWWKKLVECYRNQRILKTHNHNTKNTIISLYTTEIELFTDLPIAKIVKEGSISLNALLYCAITFEVAKLWKE